jgi:hypothetical protein
LLPKRSGENRRNPLQRHSSEPRIWVRPKEVCRLGGFGLTRCYELINDGTLESLKLGRMRLVSVASIEKLGQNEAVVTAKALAARNAPAPQGVAEVEMEMPPKPERRPVGTGRRSKNT